MTEPVAIDLRDGKKHALKYTARAYRAMSLANGGRTLAEMFRVIADDVGMTAFLHAGLLWQKPNLTMDEACDLYDGFLEGGGTIMEMVQAISEALIRSNRMERTKEPDNPPA